MGSMVCYVWKENRMLNNFIYICVVHLEVWFITFKSAESKIGTKIEVIILLKLFTKNNHFNQCMF